MVQNMKGYLPLFASNILLNYVEEDTTELRDDTSYVISEKSDVSKDDSSRINYINKNKILKYLKSGGTPIVTGFQGVNHSQRLTTLGRGGSDASAIMIAKFFNAEKCIIYTDVDGDRKSVV